MERSVVNIKLLNVIKVKKINNTNNQNGDNQASIIGQGIKPNENAKRLVVNENWFGSITVNKAITKKVIVAGGIDIPNTVMNVLI